MGLFFKRKNKTKDQEKTDGRMQAGDQSLKTETREAVSKPASGDSQGRQTVREGQDREQGQEVPARTSVTDSKGEYLWNSIDDFSRSSKKEVRSSLQIPGFYMGSGKNLPEMSDETTEELLADIRSGSTEVHIQDMRYSRTREDFEPASPGKKRRSSRKKDARRREAEPVRLTAEEKFAISRGRSGLNTESVEQAGDLAGHMTGREPAARQGLDPVKPVITEETGKTGREEKNLAGTGLQEDRSVEMEQADQDVKNPAMAKREEKAPVMADQEEKTTAQVDREGKTLTIAGRQEGSGKAGIEELRPQEAASADQESGGPTPEDQSGEETVNAGPAGQPVGTEEAAMPGQEFDDMEDEDDDSGDMDSAGRSILSMVVSLALVGLVMIFVFSFKTFLKGRTYHKPEMSAELGLEDQYQAGNQYLELDPSFLSSYIVVKELPQEGLSEDLIPGKKTNSSMPVASGQILRASGRGTYEDKVYYQLENGMYITANGINVEPLKLYVPVTGSLAITHVSSKGVKLRRWPDFKSKTNIEKYVFVGDVVNVVSRLVLADGKTGAYVTDEGLYIIDDQKYFEPHVNDPTRLETSGETQEPAKEETE